MSFDIFFQTGRFGEKRVPKKNPITGKAKMVFPEEPLSTAEVDAVRELLKRVEARGPDEYGCYRVELADGGNAELSAGNLEWGCMATLRGITPNLTHFLFDLLKAGNRVMLPVMEDLVAITASPGSTKGIPEDFPKIVVCNSPDEMRLLLTNGVNAWQRYRDQVVGNE
jgi:hypothetical protein